MSEPPSEPSDVSSLAFDHQTWQLMRHSTLLRTDALVLGA